MNNNLIKWDKYSSLICVVLGLFIILKKYSLDYVILFRTYFSWHCGITSSATSSESISRSIVSIWTAILYKNLRTNIICTLNKNLQAGLRVHSIILLFMVNNINNNKI